MTAKEVSLSISALLSENKRIKEENKKLRMLVRDYLFCRFTDCNDCQHHDRYLGCCIDEKAAEIGIKVTL